MLLCHDSYSLISLWANSAGKPHDIESQASTLELAMGLLESAIGPSTTMQSPLRWNLDGKWKQDYNNIETMTPDELSRRRAEFEKQKEIARELREGKNM